jgi:hypothetical protein
LITKKYKVWFFAGGETKDDKFNIFTGSFIRLMKEIFGEDFDYIRGIFHSTPMMNVIWALNNAQKPASGERRAKKSITAFRQIINGNLDPDTQIIIISSSSGSVVAAQSACYLARMNSKRKYLRKPFHLVLGASMISPDSELFQQLLKYQNEGIIGTILHDEVQDEGDNSFGVGGTSKSEAYANAFGLMMPFFRRKFSGPSFLNMHPVNGHIHRRRSQSVQKAYDYIDIILIKNNLAGEYYREAAKTMLSNIS